MDKSPEAGKVEIIPLLEAGTRVMGVVEFWEQYLEKIPPRQVDQSWLAKLDLALAGSFFSQAEATCRSSVGGLRAFALPSSCLARACRYCHRFRLSSLFFKQTRTGFMGRPYTLYKLRTMKKDAEKKGAEWAREKDQRVTRCRRFLRRMESR